MTDKTVAELMALADAYSAAAKDAQFAAMARDPGLKYADQIHAEARTALEQAVRRAVDWGEPVARVVNAPHMHVVGPDDGGYYGIQPITNDRLDDATPLYARNKP